MLSGVNDDKSLQMACMHGVFSAIDQVSLGSAHSPYLDVFGRAPSALWGLLVNRAGSSALPLLVPVITLDFLVNLTLGPTVCLVQRVHTCTSMSNRFGGEFQGRILRTYPAHALRTVKGTISG